MFDINLAAKILSQKDRYKKSLSEPSKKERKKASSLKFLISLILSKEFKDYYI